MPLEIEDIDGTYTNRSDYAATFIENANTPGCDIVLEYFSTVQSIEKDWFEAVRNFDMQKAMDSQVKHSMFIASFSNVAVKASGNMFIHEDQEA